MKIGLNATCINQRPSGARQRFLGIYGALVARLPEAEFVVFEPSDYPVGSWFKQYPNVSSIRTPIPSEGRARKFVTGARFWSNAIGAESFDILERYNLPIVKPASGRSIFTVHDIRAMHPRSGGLKSTINKLYLEKSLRAANHIVTVSETMKGEILAAFPGLSITVVNNGLDACQFDAISDLELQTIRETYDLPQQFILTVGHLEERKNHIRLVEAMAHLRDNGRSLPLFIVGNDSGLKASIESRIMSLNLQGSVRILSNLSDPAVRCMYKLASLFVFPSVYEGFGIPILEAMAAGCPMALSDTPVFREITQNNGVYFNALEPASIARAIEAVASSENECDRQVEYGIERVKSFSFDGLAAQIEQLYQALKV